MFELALFFTCLFTGWFFGQQLSEPQKQLIKQCAYYILLAFVCVSLWKYGLPEQAWQLCLIGALLHIIPVVIGILLKSPSWSSAFLLFGTYGGGNRGTLALSILSPALLPIFILIDLGNFLALILFYPLILLIRQKKAGQLLTFKNIQPLFISVMVIALGVMLNFSLTQTSPNHIHLLLKYALIVLTAFQIGLYLVFNKKCLLWTVVSMLGVRMIALILPMVLVYWLMFDEQMRETLWVLILFTILPVSSLVVNLLPDDVDKTFQQHTSCAITASSFIFIILLSSAFLLISKTQ